jgi:hypothetical protein
MLKSISLIILFLIFAFAFTLNLEAAGLSTTFSEVTIENLEIGKTYSTKEVASLPLSVINTGKEPVNLKIELLMPQTSELKKGFEPIPSLSWIKLQQAEFKNIKPNETATTDVLIYIPGDKKYWGKGYQVFIWSHTVGKAISIGLKSKLLFTIIGKDEKTGK